MERQKKQGSDVKRENDRGKKTKNEWGAGKLCSDSGSWRRVIDRCQEAQEEHGRGLNEEKKSLGPEKETRIES